MKIQLTANDAVSPISIQSLKIFLQRSVLPAPKFWLVNVTAAWLNADMTKYVKLS